MYIHMCTYIGLSRYNHRGETLFFSGSESPGQRSRLCNYDMHVAGGFCLFGIRGLGKFSHFFFFFLRRSSFYYYYYAFFLLTVAEKNLSHLLIFFSSFLCFSSEITMLPTNFLCLYENKKKSWPFRLHLKP